jgi:hypothetical protein
MIFNRLADTLLLKIPIYLPILYGVILYNFDSYENLLVFVTLLLLAEPHFGATWPFFLNNKNYKYIIKNKINLIILPIIITFLSIFLFFYFQNFFYLIFLIFNFFHVTRQSIGVSKLFVKDRNELEFHSQLIIFFGFIFLIIAVLRFYLKLELINDNLMIFNLIILSVIFLFLFYNFVKFKISENVYTLITGILIFYPICFVDKPVHGIIMGVTMHYIQYLALTYKISLKRLNDDDKILKNKTFNKNYLLIIILYGVIMAIFSLSNTQNIFDTNIGYLLIIPLTGQILHFYLDSFLWKFREEHHRDVTLKYLKG